MGKRKLTEEQWTDAAIANEGGEPPEQIAARLGVSRSCLNWNMLRLGADPPNAKLLPTRAPGPDVVQRCGHQVRHFSAEEDAELLRLSGEGLSVNAIAVRLGRRWNSTRGRLMTLARHDARREAA